MIDGMRYPPQGNGLCQIDPSIIPEVAIDRIDLLLDGASATYGSDAIGGVINIILRRNFDGARTELAYTTGAGGNNKYLASQLWGRTWDGGQVTVSFQWYEIQPTWGKFSERLTFNHTPWGLDNRNPLGSSMPGTISIGSPNSWDTVNYPATNGQNCTNCYAVPRGTGGNFNPINSGLGPLTPFSASTLNWATFSTNSAFHNPGNPAFIGGPNTTDFNGTQNEFNPYSISYYSAGIQYTSGVITVDQRLTKDISFYGEGIYGMRRSVFSNNATANQLTVQVPTWNPYYPTAAPTNLRVSYHFTFESPSVTHAYASAQRYQMGLNISLPYGWASQVYYAETRDAEFNHVNGTVNKAAVSAALGWTIPITPATGTTPTVATWVKPSSVPYLNLFCDATLYNCNSPTTLRYIENFSQTSEAFWINEKGIKADGPLFDIPGGTVKAAIGANYTSYHFWIHSETQNTSNPTVAMLSDPESRAVWAVFTQVNIPIFSDMFNFPLFRKFEFEASWRHDQYSDVGGTSNPKLAFNWSPFSEDVGLTIRGGWGNSFRAPNFGEFSPISNVGWNGWGLPAGVFSNNATISVTCVNGVAPANSGAAKLQGAGFTCGSQPAGLSLNGGGKASVDAHFRAYFNQDQAVLEPERSTNWAIGFDFAPTFPILRGFDVQATYYIVKINSILRNFGNPTTNRFNDPTLGFVYLVPSNVGCPGMDATPWLCANFQDMVRLALAHPTDTVPATAQTLIYWINDGGTMNAGWQRTNGIDFAASYDWDWGNLGAWNVGVVGTYYIHQEGITSLGSPIADTLYHVDLASVGGVQQLGVESLPRFKYRARLGWSNGTWSLTGFMDYASHFYHSQTAPPNVNYQCLTPGGTLGGGTFPCALSDGGVLLGQTFPGTYAGAYNNIEPSYYTFDISVGYDTGDRPANEYLRNIGIQLVVQNVFDRHSSYEYRIATGGGNPAAFDILKNIFGRQIQLRVTKTW